MDRFRLLSVAYSEAALTFLAIVVSVGLSGCTEGKDAYAQLRTPHAPLIDGFESYISSAEARKRLPADLAVRVLFEWKMTARDTRPRFDELTLRVSGFQHAGFKGDLDLEFINDRLVSTAFTTANCGAYLKILRPVGARLRQNVWRSGFTETWTHASQDGKDGTCAAWEDTRLSEEAKGWVARYS